MKTTSIFAFGLALVGTALTLAVSAGPAMATPVDARTVMLDVNPMDLATVSGRNALDARIERAVRQVCGASLSERHLKAIQAQQACVAETIAATRQAVEQLKMSTIQLSVR